MGQNKAVRATGLFQGIGQHEKTLPIQGPVGQATLFVNRLCELWNHPVLPGQHFRFQRYHCVEGQWAENVAEPVGGAHAKVRYGFERVAHLQIYVRIDTDDREGSSAGVR